MSEKCLGTEVPVDCKSVRIRLMVSQVATKSICLPRKDFGCISCLSGRSNGNPSFTVFLTGLAPENPRTQMRSCTDSSIPREGTSPCSMVIRYACIETGDTLRSLLDWLRGSLGGKRQKLPGCWSGRTASEEARTWADEREASFEAQLAARNRLIREQAEKLVE